MSFPLHAEFHDSVYYESKPEGKLKGNSQRENCMKRTLLFLAIAVACLATTQVNVFAHHSFAATYFEDQSITIQGKLVQFLYRNPHSFVHVEAPDDKGEMQTWAVEWGAGGQLSRDGVTRESLKPGDVVIIKGNPGRNPEDHRIRMQSITRPSDGWNWKGVVQ
jgi:Family of unknown function (DUF6152)